MVRSFFYLIITLASVFYALPLIPFSSNDLVARLFSIVWIIFALLLIGVHLNILIDIDFKRRIDFIKLEEYRNWEKEQKLLQSQIKDFRRMK